MSARWEIPEVAWHQYPRDASTPAYVTAEAIAAMSHAYALVDASESLVRSAFIRRYTELVELAVARELIPRLVFVRGTDGDAAHRAVCRALSDGLIDQRRADRDLAQLAREKGCNTPSRR